MVALSLLFTSLLAALAVALPSFEERHAARAASRVARKSQPPKKVPGHGPSPLAKNATAHDSYSYNWAGGVYTWPQGYIQSVTATFTVPVPSIPPGGDDSTTYWASAWVGIDGDTCGNAILQTGLDFGVQGSGIGYDAWYEWFPDYAHNFDGISFNPGDSVTITVQAYSANSGTAVIINNSNGQQVSQYLTSDSALCQEDVEWIVEDFSSGGLVPFANFGTVGFTDTVASLYDGSNSFGIGAANAAVFDIVDQNGNILTSTQLADGSVTVSYIG